MYSYAACTTSVQVICRQDAQLSQRDRAAGCVIVFAKSRTLERGDNDLVLLRIPSSRPSPRTFPQFVRVQVLGFLAAENDGFET